MTNQKSKPLLEKLEPSKPIVSPLHSKGFRKEAKEYSKMGRNLISEILWYFFGIDV